VHFVDGCHGKVALMGMHTLIPKCSLKFEFLEPNKLGSLHAVFFFFPGKNVGG
jgi:hypothetical protein